MLPSVLKSYPSLWLGYLNVTEESLQNAKVSPPSATRSPSFQAEPSRLRVYSHCAPLGKSSTISHSLFSYLRHLGIGSLTVVGGGTLAIP